jgi:protein SCO1/2
MTGNAILNVQVSAMKSEQIRFGNARCAPGCCLLCLLILSACHKQTVPESTAAPQHPSASDRQIFVASGLVKELEPDGKTVVIQHEAISNYMGAMTMPFEVRDPKELSGLNPGDAITFHLIVTSKEGWIESITRRQNARKAPPARPAAHIFSGVEPLEKGDVLPEYHFTNELGQTVSLSQYQGGVLAFTFFFTSCPFPNFCPRMTGNFAEAAAQLRQLPGAPARWHLLSISFDPKNDTPQRLQAYAKTVHYDAGHWSFLTGEMFQIVELANQFGENFFSENDSITHNLRTVVVDAHGRVRKIFQGNDWTSADLVREMVKANAD